jgi:hypothetical protein
MIKTRLARLPWHLAVPLAFLVVMFLFYPFRERFEFDRDEGVNLMKAMLVEKGYSLYEEVWSDQPPLFTLMLAFVFRVFGLKVNLARLLVLGLACVLVWACFEFTRLGWRWIHALRGHHSAAGVEFLIFSGGDDRAAGADLCDAVFTGSGELASPTQRHLVDPFGDRAGPFHLTKALTGFLAPIFLGASCWRNTSALGRCGP